MENIYKKSLKLHKDKAGKIEIKSKVKLKTKLDLSLAYTPGVARVCMEIHKNPNLARELTLKKNTVAIISDGSAVLGLGNLGALGAIPVMEGKAILFKEFAGIDAFPICVSTQDPDEIVLIAKNIAPVFGGINLEDIASPHCFEVEEKLRKEISIPMMHDDRHGTATVVLAGLINSLKVSGLKKEFAKVVISGAGAAGIETAGLLNIFGFKNIIMCDSKGIIHKARKDLNKHKIELLRFTNLVDLKGELKDAISGADIFIGLSAPKIVNIQMIKSMNKNPIIFALSNPEPEIMPKTAKEAGALIVASGRSDFPNQVNNVLAFPGIFRGALDNNISEITREILLRAACNLAGCVLKTSAEKILPDPFDKKVVKMVAKAVF
jgi:malate dehydrogenase (oxaloacetate-decarboxylating)